MRLLTIACKRVTHKFARNVTVKGQEWAKESAYGMDRFEGIAWERGGGEFLGFLVVGK
jgi:hypothetical protein